MNINLLGLLSLLSLGLAFSSLEARCRRRCNRRAAVADFLGAITGATAAARAYSDECYYREGPPYEYIYPGAPIYVYDYPTYVYAPRYAYMDIRYDIYPSYFFRR